MGAPGSRPVPACPCVHPAHPGKGWSSQGGDEPARRREWATQPTAVLTSPAPLSLHPLLTGAPSTDIPFLLS